MSLDMLVPPMPGLGYVGTQAIDHFGRHSGDARDAVMRVVPSERPEFVALGDMRKYAALGVGLDDIARREAGLPRADQEVRARIGRLSVITSATFELQHHAIASVPPAERTAAAVLELAKGTTQAFSGGFPSRVTSSDARQQAAACRGANMIYGALGFEFDPSTAGGRKLAEFRSVADPLARDIGEQFFSLKTPEQLLMTAQNIGARCIELTALVAGFVDGKVPFDSTRQFAQDFGAAGFVLQQYATLREDLRAGLPTFATKQVARAGGASWKTLREVSAMANDTASDRFKEARDTLETRAAKAAYRALRFEMQSKFTLNRFGMPFWRGRRPMTPDSVQGAYNAGPFARVTKSSRPQPRTED